MTKATRAGYSFDAMEVKHVYLRRAHPADPVELVIAPGDHSCKVYKLTRQQLEILTRDSHDLYFKTSVLA